VTKNYMIIDKATGLYFVGNAGQGKFEFGPRHKARRFPSANFAAYVVKHLSQSAEGSFEITTPGAADQRTTRRSKG